MILRSLALRHGRYAVARTSIPRQVLPWRRTFVISTQRYAEHQEEEPLSRPSALNADVTAHDSYPDAISADWAFKQHQKQLTWSVGADIEPHYRHNDPLDNPARPEDITLELLLASQCHLGHHTSLWHPGNARYIHGTWGQEHDAIHVISLDVTAAHLRRACKIVTEVTAKGGLILFVGTRDGHALPVVNAAKMARGCHLFDRWTPGTFSNAEQILGNCKKKVINHLDEEMPGFDPQLADQAAIKPDLVVCLNARDNFVLLHECGMHNIPTIGIIDTDTNPTWVTYPIPANDDSLRSVTVIAGTLGRAAEEGTERRLSRAKDGIVDTISQRKLKMPTRAEVEAWHKAKKVAESQALAMGTEEEQAAIDEAVAAAVRGSDFEAISAIPEPSFTPVDVSDAPLEELSDVQAAKASAVTDETPEASDKPLSSLSELSDQAGEQTASTQVQNDGAPSPTPEK